uniref:Uncharacterized protein n=1 Tax=Lepeophtheirus salmonis TaxID=72036 RepID=A0A0K2UBL2_LEPSM
MMCPSRTKPWGHKTRTIQRWLEENFSEFWKHGLGLSHPPSSLWHCHIIGLTSVCLYYIIPLNHI